VERQPLVPDLTLLKEVAPSASTIYCGLTEQEAQCQAALHSVMGNLLAQESAVAATAGRRASAGSALLCSVLQLSATHQRNEDAATALELLFGLAAAEGTVPILARSLDELDLMLADIRLMEQQGIPSPVSRLEIEQQRLGAQRRDLELQATIDRLNAQLAALLNVDMPPDWRFWPQTPLSVTSEIPDRDEAIAMAYAHRADLAALAAAARADSRDGLAAAQWLLRQISGGLGTAIPGAKWSLLRGAREPDDEALARCEQLLLAHSYRQRQVRHETEQSLASLEFRLAQIDVTRRKLEFAHQRLLSLEQQRALAGGAPVAARQARLEVLATEQTLLEDVIEWKRATVRLKRAQGLLALECGYSVGADCGI
jgi:outer membrane protein TolC